MAKKEGKKNGKGIKTVLIAVLVPLLIIIMISSMFFAILDAIIKIITAIINTIIEILTNPLQFITRVAAKVGNWISKVLDDDDFDIDAYNDGKIPPILVINQDQFIQMRESLSSAVNKNTAGLDDMMLKKMLVSYYSSIFTDDGQVYMEVSYDDFDAMLKKADKEKYKKIFSDNSDYTDKNAQINILKELNKLSDIDEWLSPFELEVVNLSTDAGDCYRLCISGSGKITLNGESGGLTYYTKDTLKHIYENEHKKALEDEKEDYAKSVKEALKKCYTDGPTEGTIQMVGFKGIEEKTEYIYGDGKKVSNIENSHSTSNASFEEVLVTLDYTSNSSEITVPVEVLINLLEITESKDFVNNVMKLLTTETAEMIVYEIKAKNETTTEKTYTQKTDIECTDKDKKTNITLSDTDSVTEKTTTETEELKYDVALTNATTFYSNITKENTTTNDITTENSNETFEDETVTYTSQSDSDIMHIIGSVDIFGEKIRVFLNKIFQYIINHNNGGGYVHNTMTVNKTNIKTTTTQKDTVTKIIEGVSESENNTDIFLAILSNATGTKNLGQQFVPKSQGGIVVKYDSLNGGKTGAGEMLVNGAEMLFQLLDTTYKIEEKSIDDNGEETSTTRSVTHTQGWGDMFRYILWRYSGNDYGVTEFPNIYVEGFSSTGNDWDLFVEWLKGWEGHEGITADGKEYKIGSVQGNRTVGYGIDLETSGYDSVIKNMGYDTSLGKSIPIDVIDSIMEDELNADKTYVDAKVANAGIKLKSYQLYALYDRAYNCGCYGATYKVYSGAECGTVDAIKKYWTDEKTENGFQKDPDYSELLFTKAMAYPGGVNTKRRRAEFRLFSSGVFMNREGEVIGIASAGGGANGNIAETAVWLGEALRKNNFTYHDMMGRKNIHPMIGESGTITSNADYFYSSYKYNGVFSGNGYHISCATFVTETMVHAGFLPDGVYVRWACSNTSNSKIISTIKSEYAEKGVTLEVIDASQAQPGDIIHNNPEGGNKTCHICILTEVDGDKFKRISSPEFYGSWDSWQSGLSKNWIIFRVVDSIK